MSTKQFFIIALNTADRLIQIAQCALANISRPRSIQAVTGLYKYTC